MMDDAPKEPTFKLNLSESKFKDYFERYYSEFKRRFDRLCQNLLKS